MIAGVCCTTTATPRLSYTVTFASVGSDRTETCLSPPSMMEAQPVRLNIKIPDITISSDFMSFCFIGWYYFSFCWLLLPIGVPLVKRCYTESPKKLFAPARICHAAGRPDSPAEHAARPER